MSAPAPFVYEAHPARVVFGAGALASLAGGSAVGLAKAVALTTGLPVVAAPTTYAGSEMTSVGGLTDEGETRTGRDPRGRPRAELATRNPYDNPRPVDREGVRALLAAAFEGRAPAAPARA